LRRDSSEHLPWYAIQSRIRHEKAVFAGLVERSYEAFLPLYRVRRRWADRHQDVDLPLFPGYVFCRLDINHRLPVLMIPGVLRFVCAGKVPSSVDAKELAVVQAIVRSGMLVQPWPFLKTGQSVVIEEGPLRNVAGILSVIDGSHRLVVSISLLQRSVSVNIPREWIRPVESSSSIAASQRAAVA
jgi:transcription antitermination factor NusG